MKNKKLNLKYKKKAQMTTKIMLTNPKYRNLMLLMNL